MLVAFASMTLKPTTRSFGVTVVTFALQPVTPAWVLLPVASTAPVETRPVKDAAEIKPSVEEAEKVAVSTVPEARPAGASAEAIATWSLFASFVCASTDQVKPPPLTEVRVADAWFQTA